MVREVTRRIPAQLERVAVSMRKEGFSLREIAAKVGYSHETIRTVLKRRGYWPALAAMRSKACAIPGCGKKYYGRRLLHSALLSLEKRQDG